MLQMTNDSSPYRRNTDIVEEARLKSSSSFFRRNLTTADVIPLSEKYRSSFSRNRSDFFFPLISCLSELKKRYVTPVQLIFCKNNTRLNMKTFRLKFLILFVNILKITYRSCQWEKNKFLNVKL